MVESMVLLQGLKQAAEAKGFVRFEEAQNQYVEQENNFRCGGKREPINPPLTEDTKET